MRYPDLELDLLDEEQEDEEEELLQLETALDERVCVICGPLEGEVYTLDEIEEYFPDATEGLDGIDANIHDRCRCKLKPTEYPTEEQWAEDILEMY